MENFKLENTKEENDALFISNSKKKIDDFISANDYKSAFGLLLTLLDKICDIREKNEIIVLYVDKFYKLNPSLIILDAR